MRKPHNKSQNRQKPSKQNPSRSADKRREQAEPSDSRQSAKQIKKHHPTRPRISITTDQVMIYGRHSVTAALINPNRHIRAVYATIDAKEWLQAEHADNLASHNITPIIVDRNDLAESLPPQDKHVHQGVVLVAKPLLPPLLDEWLDYNLLGKEASGKVLLVMLDQITDARNIGAIMRSALAFGAKAMIVTDRNTPTETGAMLRAASGAAERMPLIRVVNLSRAITLLQDHRFTVAGLDARGTEDLTHLHEDDRLVLVLGAEGSGLRYLTREKVDQLIRIPISDHSESLNVSNAAAVALYAATAGSFAYKKNN